MLAPGDMVTPGNDSRVYIVTGNYGKHVTAVRTVDITNPLEWALRYKAEYSVRVPWPARSEE